MSLSHRMAPRRLHSVHIQYTQCHIFVNISLDLCGTVIDVIWPLFWLTLLVSFPPISFVVNRSSYIGCRWATLVVNVSPLHRWSASLLILLVRILFVVMVILYIGAQCDPIYFLSMWPSNIGGQCALLGPIHTRPYAERCISFLWYASRISLSSSRRGHANPIYIILIVVCRMGDAF